MSDENTWLGHLKYGLIARLFCKTKRRIALKTNGSGFWFHENIVIDNGSQKMKRYVNMASPMLSLLGMESFIPKEEFLPRMRDAPHSPIVVLAPGGKFRSQWWPYFKDLSAWLHDQGIKTVLVGSADEAKLVNEMFRPGQEVMIGSDLVEVRSVIEDSSVLVCNDSGLLHVAVWCGVPVIAICGPRFAAKWTGYPEDRVVQLYSDNEEGRRGGARYRMACLRRIALDDVTSELRRALLLRHPKCSS